MTRKGTKADDERQEQAHLVIARAAHHTVASVRLRNDAANSATGRRHLHGAAVVLGLFFGAPTIGEDTWDQRDMSMKQRARREAAVQFVAQVHNAQNTLRSRQGSWGRLSDLTGVGTPPVGFVPDLTVDPHNYTIVLKDLFDRCGFVVFSDSYGVIYEGSARVDAQSADCALPSVPPIAIE